MSLAPMHAVSLAAAPDETCTCVTASCGGRVIHPGMPPCPWHRRHDVREAFHQAAACDARHHIATNASAAAARMIPPRPSPPANTTEDNHIPRRRRSR